MEVPTPGRLEKVNLGPPMPGKQSQLRTPQNASVNVATYLIVRKGALKSGDIGIKYVVVSWMCNKHSNTRALCVFLAEVTTEVLLCKAFKDRQKMLLGSK